MNRKNSNSSPSSLSFIEETPKGVYIRIRLQPRASKNTIDGIKDSALKVRLTSPPVEGEANRALIGFLSDILKTKKSSFTIDSGLKSRDKRVKVEGLSLLELKEKFSKYAELF